MEYGLPPQNTTAFRQPILNKNEPKDTTRDMQSFVNQYVQNILQQSPKNIEFRLSEPTQKEQQLADKIKPINPNQLPGGPISINTDVLQYIITNDNAIKNDKNLSVDQKKKFLEAGNFFNSNTNQIFINVSAAFDKSSEQQNLNAAFKTTMDAVIFTLNHERAHATDYALNKDRVSKFSVLNDNEQNNDKHLNKQDSTYANNMRTLSKETYADGMAAILYLENDNGENIKEKYKALQQYGKVKEDTWNNEKNSITYINHLTTHSINRIIDDHKKGLIPTSLEKRNEYLNTLREEQLEYATGLYASLSPENKKETENYLSNSYNTFLGYGTNKKIGVSETNELIQRFKDQNQPNLYVDEHLQQRMKSINTKIEHNDFLPISKINQQNKDIEIFNPKFQV